MVNARRRGTREDGFSLIELLVVMIIIGILAGITIPILLNQRRSAVDASMKSDLRNAAVLVESYRTEHASYPAAIGVIAGQLRMDDGTDIALSVDAGGEAFCLVATRRPGVPPGSGAWSYDSDGGGLLDLDVACS